MYYDYDLEDALLINENGLCCYCLKFGRVGLILDPFDLEIYDREELDWFHGDCAQERWYDT